MAIFPHEPGLAGLLRLMMTEVVVKTGAISQIVTTNKPTFYRPDAIPVAQPTVSKH